MREKTAVTIVVTLFILLGMIAAFLGTFIYSEFNFQKSEISINGVHIEEKLYFQPDKSYHTLYRDFSSPIYLTENNIPNYILINSVSCEEGEPYAYSYDGNFKNFYDLLETPLPYTEKNEYGCTFGNTLGFSKGQEYWIKSSYELRPQNLFEINNKYYVKFVVYSPNKHKFLIKDNNFFVYGESVTKDFFLPRENVLIYVPYQGKDLSSFNIIKKNSFEYDNSFFSISWIFLISLIPGIGFFVVWRFFGREKVYKDLPDSLSMYPKGRKPWEVNVFFKAPFGSSDQNLFPTLLLDFYRRKIIDLKEKENKKDVWIKIKEHKKANLDQIEKNFISFLKKIRNLGNKKYIDKEGYFNIKKSAMSVGIFSRQELTKDSRKFAKLLNEKSKKYIDSKGNYFFIGFMAIFFFLSITSLVIIAGPILIIPLAIIFVISIYVIIATTLLMKFKGNYYGEYQEWKAFKNYLKDFPSMRDSPPKAVVLWEHYLVYATALGVGKKVAKKLKEWKIIDARTYNLVVHTYSSSYSVAGSSGAAGGGFGGAGAGGVGGGGGGGR